MALLPDDQQSQHPRHLNVKIHWQYQNCRNCTLWWGEPHPKCWWTLILKRSLRKHTNTCTCLSYSIEPIFHLRILWLFIVHVLGPFLNTVCQFFIMHYLNISRRTLRGFRKGPLWEYNYEDKQSRFNLSSLGSRREAACSKLFNNMCIPSHKLHHLVLQRHQPRYNLRQPSTFNIFWCICWASEVLKGRRNIFGSLRRVVGNLRKSLGRFRKSHPWQDENLTRFTQKILVDILK